MRDPLVFFEPRFWAEEGTVFYAHSLQSGFFDGIIFAPKYTAGYFSLTATIPATVAAKFVQPEYAPFVTTYFSLIFYLGVFWMLLWGRSYVFDSLPKKILACLIVLFFPYTQATQETWLNTINLQVYCGLIAFLIAFDPTEEIKGFRLWASRGTLAFCGLSGIYAIALSPLFAGIWLWRRTRESLIRTVIIGGTGGLQLSLFLYLKHSDLLSTTKIASFFWAKSALALLVYQMIFPIFGVSWSYVLIDTLQLKQALILPVGESHQYAVLAGWVSLVLIAAIVMGLVGKRADVRAYLLLAGFICVSLVTSVFSMHGIPGGRYSVMPSILFGMLLLAVCSTSSGSVIRKAVAVCFLTLGIATGLLGYMSESQRNWDSKRPKPPAWGLQIKEWRENPDQILSFWPYPRWKEVLPDSKLISRFKRNSCENSIHRTNIR